MNNIDNRRKLLKSIVAGSGAVVAGKSFPESWSKPVIDSVMLPAHASTTDDTGSAGAPTPVTYTIICSSLEVEPSKCGQGTQYFYISGEVAASDGSSLEGVSLTVIFDNEILDYSTSTTPMPVIPRSVEFAVLVGANNKFSSELLGASSGTQGPWRDPESTISVRFTDPKYGSSTCSVEYNCAQD